MHCITQTRTWSIEHVDPVSALFCFGKGSHLSHPHTYVLIQENKVDWLHSLMSYEAHVPEAQEITGYVTGSVRTSSFLGAREEYNLCPAATFSI